jgi:hypothetical protein
MEISYLFVPSLTDSRWLKHQQCHHTIPAFHLYAQGQPLWQKLSLVASNQRCQTTPASHLYPLRQPLRRRTILLRRHLLPGLSRLLVPLHRLMLRGKKQWTAQGSEDAKRRLQYQTKRQCKTRGSIALPWRNQTRHANANRVDLVAATFLMNQPTWGRTAQAGAQSTEIQRIMNGDTD